MNTIMCITIHHILGKMDAEGNLDMFLLAAVILVAVLRARRRQARPQHNSVLTGRLYYAEIMATENVNRFRQVARMDKETFILLKEILEDGGLRDSELCAGEKIMILLHVLRGFTNRETAERWQHSGSTISEAVHEVSHYLDNIKQRIYKPALAGDPIPTQIANNGKFSPYFDDCIGALDGTHIPAVIPTDLHHPFRNRKKVISQNVLAVGNFDLTFAYGLFGWEGSAHDARVFDDAKLKGLPLIIGKYYLADGGYALTKYTLTPFRAVRYHLVEFGINGVGPANSKELFNLRHSSLRNSIERLFGIVKNRFPILKKMSPYTFEFQCDLVQCCFLMHNFVHLNQLYEDEFYDVEVINDPNILDNEDEEAEEDEDNVNYQALKMWRNNIADAMWAQYLLHIAQNNDN
jgi:DDE superfamily endonuclease